MPHIKNALIRYRIIDKCLRNNMNPYPNKQDLRMACEDALYGESIGLNICDSTIEKDLFAMRMEMDAPIKYSRRNGGYYYTNKDFSIDEIPLSSDEIQSIKFAASTLAQFKNSKIFEQFEFALDKIIERVSVSEVNNSNDSSTKIQFEQGVKNLGGDFLGPILNSIENRKVIYFNYQSFLSDFSKKRKITPLLLKQYRNRWYVISFDMVKSKVITYALDRLTEIEFSDEQGVVPINFNSDLYFKYAKGITVKENDLPVEIIFTTSISASKYIHSQPFHDSQKIFSESEKKITFSLYMTITEELIREFLSYSDEIEIISPSELRQEIKKRIKNTYEIYRKN